MKKEFKTLKIQVYRDTIGLPTCLLWYPDKFCEFLGTKRFGTTFVCMLHPDCQLKHRINENDLLFLGLKRIVLILLFPFFHEPIGYEGWFKPHENCPLWKKDD